MKPFAVIILALVYQDLGAVAAGEERDLAVEFAAVISGHSFQRDSDDRLYSAVIWNAQGYRDFLERYPLPVAGLKPAFMDTHVFVVGFSDKLQEAFCDGVSRQSYSGSSYYYLDLHDTGLEFKRGKPSDGMKYSCWVLVRLPRPKAISHIQVREGVVGGLSEQFGNPLRRKPRGAVNSHGASRSGPRPKSAVAHNAPSSKR